MDHGRCPVGEGFGLGSEKSGILLCRQEGGSGKRIFQPVGTAERRPGDEDSGGCLATRLAGAWSPRRGGQVVGVRVCGALPMGPNVWTSFVDTRKQLCCLRRGVVASGAGGVCGWEVGGQGAVSGRLDQARAAV